MEFAWPFARSPTTSPLQSAYSEYQIGAFENFHQPVEEALAVLRPRQKVFFQYELRFANGLNSQLLISHRLLLIKMTNTATKERRQESSQFWGISPLILGFLINFCFNMEPNRHPGFVAPAHSVRSSSVIPGRAKHENPYSRSWLWILRCAIAHRSPRQAARPPGAQLRIGE
jgi:hypothetical protein